MSKVPKIPVQIDRRIMYLIVKTDSEKIVISTISKNFSIYNDFYFISLYYT